MAVIFEGITIPTRGHFDQERMLEVFEQLASGNAKAGFPLSRIVCHMDWAATGGSHFDNLVEFESRVNDVWCRHNDAVICVYDLAKFGGDTVIDIMRTHPMIIIGGILQQYSFFIPPAQFVRELREQLPGGTCHARRRLDMELQCEDPAEENMRLQRCI
jgi:hypothetical protein